MRKLTVRTPVTNTITAGEPRAARTTDQIEKTASALQLRTGIKAGQSNIVVLN